MKSRIITSSIICIFLLCLYYIRITHINKNNFYPNTIMYNFGSEVDFGKDFFDNEQDSATGYSITILDNEIIEKKIL